MTKAENNVREFFYGIVIHRLCISRIIGDDVDLLSGRLGKAICVNKIKCKNRYQNFTEHGV